jgi:hypothetical protein
MKYFWLLLSLMITIGKTHNIPPKIISFGGSIRMESTEVELEIGKHKYGNMFLKNVRLNGQQGIIQEPKGSMDRWKICPLWSLSFIEPEISFSSNSADYLSADTIQINGFQTFVNKWSYKNERLDLTITVFASIEGFTNSTTWDLEIQSNNSRFFKLEKVIFPIIGDMKLSGDNGNIRLVYPQSWGYEYLQAEDHNISYGYPSSGCQMQFAAYYNDKTNEGLYISTRDLSPLSCPRPKNLLIGEHPFPQKYVHIMAIGTKHPNFIGNGCYQKHRLQGPIEIKTANGYLKPIFGLEQVHFHPQSQISITQKI